MSEWGYLAKIIKDAKKISKVQGRKAAKKFATLPEDSVIVTPNDEINQQLRNFLDGIQSERLTNFADFEESTSPYTRHAAEDLLNNMFYGSSVTDGNSLYNLSSIAEGVAGRDWLVPRGAFIDTNESKLRNIDALEEAIKRKKFMEDYTNYINKQRSLGKNVAPLEDWYLDEPFDVNKAARDILEEKAANEGRKLSGEFKLERPDGSGL